VKIRRKWKMENIGANIRACNLSKGTFTNAPLSGTGALSITTYNNRGLYYLPYSSTSRVSRVLYC